MSKIYVVDYGLSGCKKNETINKLLEDNGWKCTGFNTTYWKDIDDKCNVKEIENKLGKLIQQKADNCTVTLLIVCVDKSDVIGTKDSEIIFGCNFKSPQSNNKA
ncbi:MAG: hypothetical protein AB7S65_04765 [Sulfuricurvum sp.]